MIYYHIEDSPELHPITEELMRSPLVAKWRKTQAVVTKGLIEPGMVVPVIAPNKQGRSAVFPMKWGFQEQTRITEVKTEAAAAMPVFKECWVKRRCIIPASWYYEREQRLGNDGKKHPGDLYMLQPTGATMTWIAGLYRIEDGLPVFVVLTQRAKGELQELGDQIPLIFPEERVKEWIEPGRRAEEVLRYSMKDMIYEPVDESSIERQLEFPWA